MLRAAGLRLTGDMVAALVALIFSIGLYVVAGDLPSSALVPIGPGFYPRLVLGLTALASLALLVRGFVLARQTDVGAPRAGTSNYGLVLVAFILFGLYVGAIPLLGFRLATFFFVALMQVAIERPRTMRGWGLAAIIAIATALGTHLVFEHYLQVLLPRGSRTGF